MSDTKRLPKGIKVDYIFNMRTMATGGLMGMLVAVLLMVGHQSLGQKESQVAAFVVDDFQTRPVIRINSNYWEYLFAVELDYTSGRVYTQRITVKASNVGFTPLEALEASDIYAPVVDTQ